MIDNPKITVYMPVFNGARYLKDAISSVLQQVCADFELSIFDDGSTDTSLSLISWFNDHRISVTQNERNLGLVGNTNAAISQAQGQYISCLHQDDVYQPNLLEQESTLLDMHPTVGFVFSAYDEIDANGRVMQTIRPFDKDCIFPRGDLLSSLILGNNIQWCTVMVRKTCYQEAGLHDENLEYSSDWDMWLRLANRYDVAYINTPLAQFRWHDSKISLSYLQNKERLYAQEFAALVKAFWDTPLSREKSAALREKAMAALAYRVTHLGEYQLQRAYHYYLQDDMLRFRRELMVALITDRGILKQKPFAILGLLLSSYLNDRARSSARDLYRSFRRPRKRDV